MAVVAGIDLGSQSAKVVVVDGRGRVLASAQHRLRPTVQRGGTVVHPDDDLWDALVAAAREAVGAYDGAEGPIVAVGLCSIRFCRAYLDERGRLVEPVLSWMDERLGRPHEQTGWHQATASSGYLTLRLTGERRDAAGSYEGVWPVDRERWAWGDDDAFAAAGLRREQVFELVPPGGALGSITAAAARETGLPAGVPLVATSNDKAVEALGSGLRRPDQLLLSLGTYIASMTVDDPGASPSGGIWRNFGAEPGVELLESEGIRRGMWTVSWFRELVGNVPEAELERLAAAVPVGSGGLRVVLDWLAPGDAAHRRGAMVGFDGSQGRGAIHRAILEGIACTMARHRDELERQLGRRFTTLVVSGGGARSPLMLQLLADVYGLPVERRAIEDAAGLGAAIAAAVAIGLHPSWDAAAHAMVETALTVEPVDNRADALALRASHDRIAAGIDALLRQ